MRERERRRRRAESAQTTDVDRETTGSSRVLFLQSCGVHVHRHVERDDLVRRDDRPHARPAGVGVRERDPVLARRRAGSARANGVVSTCCPSTRTYAHGVATTRSPPALIGRRARGAGGRRRRPRAPQSSCLRSRRRRSTNADEHERRSRRARARPPIARRERRGVPRRAPLAPSLSRRPSRSPRRRARRESTDAGSSRVSARGARA